MNILRADKKTTIITLLTNGVSQREIKRKTNIDRKTIRKYAKQYHLMSAIEGSNTRSPTMGEGAICQEDRSEKRDSPVENEGQKERQDIPSHTGSACEAHREWIEEQVRLGRNAMAIYQDLVERFNFTHRYNSVKRFVRGLKKQDPKQFDRLEFPPGEEAQVDYGLGAKTRHSSGRYRRPRLFVMTLKYSQRAFRKVVWRSGQQVWAKLHEEAFRYFGGCPRYVVLDNLKEGIITPDIYEPVLNPVYAGMLEHYGVVADPARVGDPNRKGTVENAIKHTQDTGLKGRTFESIQEQNEWLMHWEQRWASQRIHGRAKRQVEEMFQSERPFLRRLPLTTFRYFNQETRTVWDDGTIQVGQSYYSALPAPLYSKVIVRIYDFEIEIIDPRKMQIIRRHSKSDQAGYAHIEPKDRIFNPSQQTKYLFAKAEQIGPETKKLCTVLFQAEGRTGQRRIQGIVNLARRYEARHIEEAAQMAVKVGLCKYKSICRLVKGIAEKEEGERQQDTLIQEHELIRAPEDYAAFWEQHAACARIIPEGSRKDGQNKRFLMPREELKTIWQTANWLKVIEVFGLEVDSKRRCKPDEIWIKSPFTDEKTASVHLNLKENIFKDFSSGKGAGILNFCQELLRKRGKEMNCYEVALWMKEKGISAIGAQTSGEKDVFGKRGGEKIRLEESEENRPIRVDLCKWFRSGHPELLRRGISEATCRYLGCGFLPERAGGSPLNGRIVFQVRGVRENGSGLVPVILTHVGRALRAEDEKADGKYWSFPFFKKLEIYNQDKLLLDKGAWQQMEHFGLVLVEGFFDVAALVGSGCLNAGALMGSQITYKQIERLKFISSHVRIHKIMVFFDRDEAGIAGAEKAVSLLRSNGFIAEAFNWNQSIYHSGFPPVRIPDNIKDPGDMSARQLQWLRKQGKI